MSDTIKTRFAPSPTGHLHIGGARTALYNWLFARRAGGRFVLRIEDTDIERNVPGAESKIREDLDWVGLTPDESPWVQGPDAPYRQSERLAEYQQYAQQLIKSGHAYYALDTAEELTAMREAAKKEKRQFKYRRSFAPSPFKGEGRGEGSSIPSHSQGEGQGEVSTLQSRDRERAETAPASPIPYPLSPTPSFAPRTTTNESEVAAARAQGRTPVIRMTAPSHPITVHDIILGDVTIQPEEMEDFVILKGNGWPTYHFAVVVNDQAMHITHVIRAQEHLMNTPKHIALQDALGFRRPIYAHVPIVMNMDGTKMSKRDKHKAVRTKAAEWIRNNKWTPADVARTAGISDEAAAKWLDKADIEMNYDQLAKVAEGLSVAPPEIEVNDFRRAGYLPETVLNFIALAGWSPGEDREKMTLKEMTQLFTLDRVGKTPAKFDREKLLSFNTDACAAATPKRLREAYRDYARANQSERAGSSPTPDSSDSHNPQSERSSSAAAENPKSPPSSNLKPQASSPLAALDDATLDRAITACKGFRTFADVDTKVGILFAPDDSVQYDPDAVKKVLAKNNNAGYAILEKLKPALEALTDWTPDSIDTFTKQFAEQNNLKLGDLAQPLRVALTGRTISPTISETLSFLGRPKSLARIARCLALPK